MYPSQTPVDAHVLQFSLKCPEPCESALQEELTLRRKYVEDRPVPFQMCLVPQRPAAPFRTNSLA